MGGCVALFWRSGRNMSHVLVSEIAEVYYYLKYITVLLCSGVWASTLHERGSWGSKCFMETASIFLTNMTHTKFGQRGLNISVIAASQGNKGKHHDLHLTCVWIVTIRNHTWIEWKPSWTVTSLLLLLKRKATGLTVFFSLFVASTYLLVSRISTANSLSLSTVSLKDIAFFFFCSIDEDQGRKYITWVALKQGNLEGSKIWIDKTKARRFLNESCTFYSVTHARYSLTSIHSMLMEARTSHPDKDEVKNMIFFSLLGPEV